MTIGKLDRRKKYTRMVLKQSLLQLLQKKTLSTITVKEICEIADVNRSTFYAHYADLFELYEQIEEEIIDDLNIYLNAYNINEGANDLNITKKLIAYFAEKQDVIKVLLKENSEPSFQNKVLEVVRPLHKKHWMAFEDQTPETAKYIQTFILAGSIELIKTWLMHGMDQSPEEIAELISQLVNHGVAGFK